MSPSAARQRTSVVGGARRRPPLTRLLRPLLLLLLALGACSRDGASPFPGVAGHGARDPAAAVQLLSGHIRRNDLAGFARDAVPPALHRQLQTGWRAGSTRWPLDELPFDERLPGLLGALAAPDAPTHLQQVFDQQISGQATALRTAAHTLGLFGAQYVQHERSLSEAERAHYAQFVHALSSWAAEAPLADAQRARTAIPRLAAAARAAGLRSKADFTRLGMDASLARLSGVLRALKHVLARYGLDVDGALDGLTADVVEQNGDHAQVRMRYTLGGSPVEAVVGVERIDGRWYLSDYLRHAREAVSARQPTVTH